MGRKRLHKQTSKSPGKLKKARSSSNAITTIDSMFKRNEQVNDSEATKSNETTSDDCLVITTRRANICGETDLDTIIEIIDEWINTEEEILDEDVAYISKFFIDLANEKEKTRIQTIVNHFYESVSKRDSAAHDWRCLYNDCIGLISSDFEELNFEFF